MILVGTSMTLWKVWKWRLRALACALIVGLWVGFFVAFHLSSPMEHSEPYVVALLVAVGTYAVLHMVSMQGADAMAAWSPLITVLLALGALSALAVVFAVVASLGPGPK